MFGKKTKWLGLILATTGVPYFATEPKAFESLKDQAVSLWQTSSSKAIEYIPGQSSERSTTTTFFASLNSPEDGEVEPAPSLSFDELLRFEIDPRWIINHWPRVSTVLADQNLEGLRVPVMTGTALDDVAGSVTYYFDKQHRVQRIILDGFTGDERKLVAYTTTKFQLQSQPTLAAGLYCYKWNGRPLSVLRVSLAPVVRSSSPNTRLAVMLELNRPGGYSALSRDFQNILEADRHARRW